MKMEEDEGLGEELDIERITAYVEIKAKPLLNWRRIGGDASLPHESGGLSK